MVHFPYLNNFSHYDTFFCPNCTFLVFNSKHEALTGFSRCLKGTRRSFFDRSSHPTQLHSYSTKGCSLTSNLSIFMAMNVSSVTGVLHQSPHGAMSSDLLVCGEVLLFWFGVPSEKSVIFRIWDCLAGYF